MEHSPPSVQKRKVVSRMDYSDLINLRGDTDVKYLPGLGVRRARRAKESVEQPEEGIQEPQLLKTAIAKKREDDNQGQHQYGSFVLSRQATPVNPLNPKKRKKRMSMCSDLIDMQSIAEEKSKTTVQVHKLPGFRLYDVILGQCEAVFMHVFGRQKTVNPKLIQHWKQCLLHEDKTEIFLKIGQTPNIPYTHSRIYRINDIEKGLLSITGSGKNRCLKPGEQSSLIEGIHRYLKICTEEPTKISRKDFDIVTSVLVDCKLAELQKYPNCLKQVEAHLKIMATRWRYSIDSKDRKMEGVVASGKNNFIDLGKKGILASYLLANSNLHEF